MQQQQQQHPDVAPKVQAFRGFCLQITEQLCQEFEREVAQMSQDILRYRGELARCADLLAFQLGKEKQYHNMLENIAGNTSALVGKASEVGQKHSGSEPMKQQMHDMLEHMFNSGKGGLAETFGHFDEHRQMAETHLMTSSELQNQSQAVQKELDNILQTLNMAPVSYQQAPVIMGPSMQPQQQAPFRPPMSGATHGGAGTGSMMQLPMSPTPRSNPTSPVARYGQGGPQLPGGAMGGSLGGGAMGNAFSPSKASPGGGRMGQLA